MSRFGVFGGRRNEAGRNRTKRIRQKRYLPMRREALPWNGAGRRFCKAKGEAKAKNVALLLCALLFSCLSCGTGERGGELGQTGGNAALESAYTAEELYDYFTYLAVGSEYIDYDRVCRWDTEILYRLEGAYTDLDEALVERLCADLNRIEGFPGIVPAEEGEEALLTISFLPRSEIIEKFTYATDRIEGITEYTAAGDTCHIQSARVAVDCNLTNGREAALCEEIVQSLGLGNDSMTYADSIFYDGACGVDYPTALDFDMVRLLYCGQVKAGMGARELSAAVRLAVGLEAEED